MPQVIDIHATQTNEIATPFTAIATLVCPNGATYEGTGGGASFERAVELAMKDAFDRQRATLVSGLVDYALEHRADLKGESHA